MHEAFFYLFGAAIVLFVSQVSLAEVPSFGSVSIANVDYQGTGCNAGTVAANLSADGLAMTRLFAD